MVLASHYADNQIDSHSFVQKIKAVKMKLWQKCILPIFAAIAMVFVSLAIAGGVVNYSPVPFWDEWDGYIDFFLRAANGEFGVWWDQHNEHRIVLSRILFWMDLAWFNGSKAFLIAANYLFVAATCGIFYLTLKERLGSDTDKFARRILGLVIVVLLFSWIQNENLIQSFQIAFFLAQLLPFTAFVALYKASVSDAHQNKLFFIACLIGVAAIGSMANGVLVLPLMALLAPLLRLGWRRTSILAALAVLSCGLYFYDYNAPQHHGSLKNALFDHPLELLKFIFLYLGGPIYYALDESEVGVLFAKYAGLFLIASALFFTQKTFQSSSSSSSSSSLDFTLLTFLLFIGGSALATAGGRIIFGIGQSLAGRYQTPALLAWATLLLLCAPALAKNMRTIPVRIIATLLFVPLLLLPQQIKALERPAGKLFDQLIAALALELAIKDQAIITSIYPSVEHIFEVTKIPAKKNLSIFGNPLIKDVRQSIGQPEPASSPVQCLGALDMIEQIDSNAKFVRIMGWLYQPAEKSPPKTMRILNEEGLIVGYALTGRPPSDFRAIIGPTEEFSGYQGYLLADQLGQRLIIKGAQPDCQLSIVTHTLLYPLYEDSGSSHFISTRVQ